MAGRFEICFSPRRYPNGDEAVLDALDLLGRRWKSKCRSSAPTAKFRRINRTAAAGPVEVEPRLFALLELAMRLCRETGGAYDITSAPLWEAWGFARRAGAVPDPQQLAEALGRVGGQFVELDGGRRTVRFLREGVKLNLGSIGKGYAADRCGQSLCAAGVHDFLINADGSSVLARGEPTAPAGHWLIGVRHPTLAAQRLGELRLRDQAVGTSGTQFQSFYHRGRRYGHMLDPRTGWPAEALLSATVLAPTAALADALSTAFFVMGPAAAQDYLCEARGNCGRIDFPTRAGSVANRNRRTER